MSSQALDSGGGGFGGGGGGATGIDRTSSGQVTSLQNQTSNSSTSSSSGIMSGATTTSSLLSSSITPQQQPGQTSVSFMDDLVKEYLLFRGFQSTLKSLEHEMKSDKSNSFRADKCTDLLLSYVHAYDLTSLLEFWSYLDQKFFARLTLKLPTSGPHPSFQLNSSLSRKYELFILRYYLVYAVQTSRQDKAIELLEQCANKLQSQPEWRDWFMLPFLKSPEDNPVFSVYFNRNWIDTFMISLQNFLNIVFQSLPFPRLLNYDEDAFWNKHPQQQQQQRFYQVRFFFYLNRITLKLKLISLTFFQNQVKFVCQL